MLQIASDSLDSSVFDCLYLLYALDLSLQKKVRSLFDQTVLTKYWSTFDQTIWSKNHAIPHWDLVEKST